MTTREEIRLVTRRYLTKFYRVGICAVASDVAHGAVLGARSVRLQADIYITDKLPSALNLIEAAFQVFLLCLEPPVFAAHNISLHFGALKKRFVHRSPPIRSLTHLSASVNFLKKMIDTLTQLLKRELLNLLEVVPGFSFIDCGDSDFKASAKNTFKNKKLSWTKLSKT